MWRRLLALVLSLPGLAFLSAALLDANSRPVAILTVLTAPTAVVIGRWRARRGGRRLRLRDYFRLGASGPAVVLIAIVALENAPALKLLQAAAGGALFGGLATSAALALMYAHSRRLPGARTGVDSSPPVPGAEAPPRRPIGTIDDRIKAKGRIVDERSEGVTGRTEQECPHCGEWTLLASPICRSCGRSTIDTPVGAA